MRKAILAVIGVGAALLASIGALHPLTAQGTRCEEHPIVCKMISKRLGEVEPEDRINPTGAEELSYGPDPSQRIDYWQGTSKEGGGSLLIFIHGGGWTRGDKASATGPAKVNWATANGYDFASVNYRLVPKVTVEDQARDIAAAIRYLRHHAGELGFDADRIMLAGHSAGSHLAALIGTDERYLGDDLKAIRAVILLDGAGYDLPRQLRDAGRFEAKIYAQPFGSLDAATLTRLSPTAHAGPPNANSFLIIYDAERANAVRQSEGLDAALRQAGTPAELLPVKGSNHIGINFDLGKAGNVETMHADAFLAKAGLASDQ